MTYTDKETIEKFKIVAKQENRTMSKELEHIIQEKIKKHEKENGEIILPQDIIKEVTEKQKEIDKLIDIKSISD